MGTGTLNKPESEADSNPIQQHYDDEFAGPVDSKGNYAKDATPGELSGAEADAGKGYSKDGGDGAASKSDLKNAEAGAGAGGALGGLGGGLKGVAGKVLGNRRNNTIAGVLITAVIGILSFFLSSSSGVLQFIQNADFLSRAHFGAQDDFMDKESSRAFIYMLAGKNAKGRLGGIANKYADRWERRMNNESGLRSVYAPGNGRLIGYQVLDEDKAKDFLQDMHNDGIPTTDRMTGVTVNGDKVRGTGKFVDLQQQKYRVRRAVTRTAVKSVHLNRVSSYLGSRMLKKRAGVDFHPMKYVPRKASDKISDWRQQRQDEKAAELADGPDGAGSPLKDIIQELKTKLTTFLEKIQGPAIVFGAVCTIKDIDKSVDAQNYANIQQLERYGMNVVTTGEQIKNGNDTFSIDQIDAYSDMFYDPVTKTSFNQGPGYAYEAGQVSNAKDYVKDEKPTGDGLPGVLGIAAKIPTGIGPADACIAVDKIAAGIGDLPLIKQGLEATSKGIDLVLAQFGTSQEEIMKAVINFFANGGVNMKARGALAGEQANLGVYLAANDQFDAYGGRQLTSAEATQVKQRNSQNVKAAFARESLYNRYLNFHDSRSMASAVFMASPKSGSQLAASMMRLPQTISSMVFAPFSHKALAATPTYNYGAPLRGYSTAEMDDPAYEDPYANETYLLEGDRLERMNDEYGMDCFDMTIGRDGTLNYGKSKDFHKIPAKCNDITNKELTAYRFYHAQLIDGLGRACWEGDEEACTQIGMNPPAAGQGNITIATMNTVNADIHMDDIRKIVGGCGSEADCITKISTNQSKEVLGQANNEAFDIVSTEETSPRQYRELKRLLTGYDAVPSTTQDINRLKQSQNGATTVMWNTSKLTKVQEGKIPELSNVASFGDHGDITAPWVELQDKDNNKYFVLTIHWPNQHYFDPRLGDVGTLRKGFDLTKKNFIDVHKDEGTVIVMGDFNDHPEERNTYCWLTQNSLMQNGYDLSKGEDPGKPCPSSRGSHPGFTGSPDNIYVTPTEGLVGSNWTHMSKSNPITAHSSDHTPVYVKIGFGQGEGDSSATTCAAGKDLGTADGYKNGKKTIIRICNVQGIVVNAQISGNLDKLLNAAHGAGVPMSGGGFRTMEEQIAARRNNNCPNIYTAPASSCSPPTAQPGFSNHQMGLAIDFTAGGSIISGGSAQFRWLKAHAATYGLKNLPSESWHWSVDGR